MENNLIEHELDYGNGYFSIVSESFAPKIKKDMVANGFALMISHKCPENIKTRLLKDFPDYIKEVITRGEKIY